MLGRSVPMATQHSRLAVDLLEHHYGGFEGNQRPCFQEDTHIYTHTHTSTAGSYESESTAEN